MREIKLTHGLCTYDVRTPFPVGDLELYISGLSDSINAEFRLVAFNNDSKIGEYTLNRNNPYISIPREKLSAGVFSCRVLHYQGDTIVHRYTVENLIITDIDDTLSATPEIVELNDKITALTAKADELEERITEQNKALETANAKAESLTEELANINAFALRLLKWAYGVECSVPFLDGGSVTDFIGKLNITLSDKEKAFVGGNENV